MGMIGRRQWIRNGILYALADRQVLKSCAGAWAELEIDRDEFNEVFNDLVARDEVERVSVGGECWYRRALPEPEPKEKVEEVADDEA